MSKKLTTDEFIANARKVHGNKYDYSKVDYKGDNIKVCIICPTHGEFWQTPNNHSHGKGCKECMKELLKTKYTSSSKEFIEKAKKIHGDKYDYSKVNYINSRTKVCIICPTHGEFWQTPNSHLRKHGCPNCKIDDIIKRQTMSNSIFIEKARKVHGDKYNYSNVRYVNAYEKVRITCPIHGDFLQTPTYHLSGNGCPCCKNSHLENEIKNLLKKENIQFKQGHRFNWLGLQHLDFYLPKYNIAIECQGEQHYEIVELFGGEENFKKTQMRDQHKKALCEENGIKLLYFTHYKGIDEDENTFKDKNKLLNEIESYGLRLQ